MKTGREENWKIREAVKEDWVHVSEISRIISESDEISDYINRIGPAYLEKGSTLILEEDEVIGYLHLQWNPDHSIYISGLRVHPSYRRLGAGKFLIKEAMTLGKKAGKTVSGALIEPFNSASIALFSSLGYRRTEQFNFYEGMVDLEGFSESENWPDGIVDIGFRYVRPFRDIPARLFRKHDLCVSVSKGNLWTDEPSYTILSDGEYHLIEGNNRVTVPMHIKVQNLDVLKPLKGFPTAIFMEADLV